MENKENNMFNQFLEQAHDIGGVFTSCAINDSKLKSLKDSLSSLKTDLPDEYIDFLSTTDGMYWGGLEFFGSSIISDKKTGSNITDLYSQNRIFQALNPDSEKVALGRTDEENYLYNPSTKTYEIVDEFSGETIKTFKHFSELFQYLLKEQVEIIQNYVSFNEDEIVDESSSDF